MENFFRRTRAKNLECKREKEILRVERVEEVQIYEVKRERDLNL